MPQRTLADELVSHIVRAVVHRHAITVVGQVEREILSHDRQADEANITCRC